MALICPDVMGEILLLQYIVGCAQHKMGVDESPVLRLYSNNLNGGFGPNDLTVLADLYEVTSAGYAPITLVPANWTTTQTGGGVTSAVYTERTFTFGTDATAYGYYVTTTDDNGPAQLLWLEQFSGAPFRIPDGGGTISITAKLTLS